METQTTSQPPQRKSIRLKNYDYSQNGAYFITVCTQNRDYLFGEIIDEKMKLNDAGRMIDKQWHELPKRFNHISLDEYVVMPNHLHGIIVIRTTEANTNISNIVGAFKSITTHEYIKGVKNSNWPPFDKKIWQRNYYEHVIRNDESLYETREYIINNPMNWQQDNMNRLNVMNTNSLTCMGEIG